MHERIINVLVRALFLNFMILQVSFRFGRSISGVEVSLVQKKKRGLSKIFKESIASSISMDTTAKSEDKKEFKFKIRVKDTRPLCNYLGVISS
jgi:hypothetical protein